MLGKYKTLRDVELSDKVVLVRVDLNVPIVHGRITDKTRIKRIVPTIEYLVEKRAKIVLLSHFARPKGRYIIDMSLSPLVDALAEELKDRKIKFCVDILSSDVKDDIKNLGAGEILLVENLRFHAGEESNDQDFAKHIASLGDVYVNDAFSCSHRAHASIQAITNYIPSVAGLLLQEELENLSKYLDKAEAPITAIVGGSKVSTKIDLLFSLIDKVDNIFVAGAMCNSFLKAMGENIGNSKYEEDYLETAKNIIDKARDENCNIILPEDVVTSVDIGNKSKCNVSKLAVMPSDNVIFDIGPTSVFKLVNLLKHSSTVVWNGPLGAFEYSPFDVGTIAVAQAIAELTSENKIVSVIGGGDVVSAVTKAGLEENFTYCSTGGGAFLEWLEGKSMPGIEALCIRL